MKGNTNEQQAKQTPVAADSSRYVSLAEHQALQAQFAELVKHIEAIRFNGPSIELPDDLQILIGLKVVEKVAE